MGEEATQTVQAVSFQMKRLLVAHTIGEYLSSWMQNDGCATCLQSDFDAGCPNTVDLGEGIMDYLDSKELVQCTNSSYRSSSAILVGQSASMPRHIWDRIVFRLASRGIEFETIH